MGGFAPPHPAPTCDHDRPATTRCNRFLRRRKIGVCDRFSEAVTKAYDGDAAGPLPRRRSQANNRRRNPHSARDNV